MQIVGTVSCICMGNISLSYLAEVFQKSYLLQNLEGFFHASQAGNCYYGEEGWMHEGMELQFNVGKRSFLLPKGYGLENDYMNRTLYRFLDMANPSSYLPSVFAYLLLSVLLLIFAISLTNNREISKELFCFEAGRYLLCGLVAVTVFAILAAMGGIEHIWYVICICLCSILAAVRLYLALQDKRDAERISFFAKKAK